MKKVVLILFISCIALFSDNTYELKLYEKILPLLFKNKPLIIFTDKNTYQILKQSKKFEISQTCDQNTTVIIGKNFEEIPDSCKNKPLFATSYRWYKNYPNSFGAFYWRKGRPQLKFNKKRSEKLHIILPESLKKYEDDR